MAIEVFFGTNREVTKHNQKQQPIMFGSRINNQQPFLYFGKAKISKDYKNLKEVYTPTNIISEELCCSQDIFNAIQNCMNEDIDTICLFHGYNHTFEESLIEAARLKSLYEKQSNCKYTVIVFSWPSEGKPFAYKSDRYDAVGSAKILSLCLYKMSCFLMELCWLKLDKKTITDTGGKNKNQNNQLPRGRLHIIAHSMGTYVLRHVLQELCKITGGKLPKLFNEILLIAADEDKDAFEYKHKLQTLPKLATRVSVYFNKHDMLLKASDWFMNNPSRLGSEGPGQSFDDVPGNVFFIDCSSVASGFKKHDYHMVEAVVRHDICCVLAGQRLEDTHWRAYSAKTNSYVLTDLETTEEIDVLSP